MKTEYKESNLNNEDFIGFVKLSREEKIRELLENGVFLESEKEKECLVKLYYLNGFFVELEYCQKTQELIRLMPFKRGYRLENYFELKQVYFPSGFSRSGNFSGGAQAGPSSSQYIFANLPADLGLKTAVWR